MSLRRSGEISDEKMPVKQARLEKESKTSWFDLPFEMREMIIDEMDAKTRCKFAMCSKQCEKEAKESNNYMYAMEIDPLNHRFKFEFLDITDGLDKCGAVGLVEFKDSKTSQTVVRYRVNKSSDVLLEKSESGNKTEVFIRYAKEYLQKYKKSLKLINIKNFNEIGEFKQLDLNMLRKLETLFYNGDDMELSEFTNIINFEKVSKLDFHMRKVNFTFEEILKLDGQEASFTSKELTEENVETWLKMLKNEEIHQNMIEFHVFTSALVWKKFEEYIVPQLDAYYEEEPGFHFKSRNNKKKTYYADFNENELSVYCDIID